MRNLEQLCHTIRKDIVSTLATAGCGASRRIPLSAVEIATELYFDKMHIRPEEPRDPDRDRFILSKGHATLMLYSVLAERGYFPVEELKNFRKNWSRLPGPSRHEQGARRRHDDRLPGPGPGGCQRNGAWPADGKGKDYYVYVLMGDGELQEGMIWEAAMAAAHYRLDHLIAFVDRNGLQIDGPTEQVMGLEPLADKWRSFGWHVQEIDGHDLKAISDAVDLAKTVQGKPSVIIDIRIGVSFMENKVEFHGKAITPEAGCHGDGGNGGVTDENRNRQDAGALHPGGLWRRADPAGRGERSGCGAGRGSLRVHDDLQVCREVSGPFLQHGHRGAEHDGNRGGLRDLRDHPDLQHLLRVCLPPVRRAGPHVHRLSQPERQDRDHPLRPEHRDRRRHAFLRGGTWPSCGPSPI